MSDTEDTVSAVQLFGVLIVIIVASCSIRDNPILLNLNLRPTLHRGVCVLNNCCDLNVTAFLLIGEGRVTFMAQST